MPLDAPRLTGAEVIPPGDRSVHVVACPHPFRVERIERHFDAGPTLAEILAEIQPLARLRRYARIWIGGHGVPAEVWDRVRPKPGARVEIRVVPGDGQGKNPLAIVLSIAVLAFAFAAPQLLVGAGAISQQALTATVVGSLTVGQLITTGIGLAGTLLINALIKPSLPKQDQLAGRQFQASPSISGARNRPRPNAPIPWVFGKARSYPPLGALSFTEIVGEDQYVRVLVIWGYGPLNVSDVRIGETAIGNFEDVLIETRRGFPADPPLSLFPGTVFEESLSIALTAAAGWQVRTTQVDTDEISIDIGFLQGLARIDEDGDFRSLSVTVEIETSPAGLGQWTSQGSFVVSGREFQVLRRNRRIPVARGQYDVRLRRTTPDRSAGSGQAVADTATWTTLRSIKNEDPVQLSRPLAKTAFRIKATDQLQGQIDEINAVVESIVPDWDAAGQAWVQRPSSNPAALYRHALQGPGNAKAVRDVDLDLPSIQAWHEKCATSGYAFNLVVDFRTTAEELLFDIAAAGRARKVLPDGRYSVVIDDLKPAVAQHFTPRNSWGFSVEISFKDELPHALRIPFMNEQAGYLEDQRLVYRDGFDVFNATKVEKLELRGITDPALIWKHGRYHFAQAELRPDGYSFFADIEHLLCNVGDRVELSHDVISAGLGRGRIKAVLDDGAAPPNAVAIELDDRVEMAAGASYGVRVRLADGTSQVKTVQTAAGVQNVLTFSVPFPLAEAPEVDDLFLFGEAGRESVSLLIVGIERAQDLSAKLRCVDYAPAVQEADAGPVPPFQSSVVSPALLPKPEIIGVRSDDTAMYQGPDGSWTGRIVATVEIPSDLDPLVIGIEGQYRLQGASGSWSRTAIQNLADNQVVLEPVEDKQTYELRLRYVRNTLRPGPWSDLVVHTVAGKLRRPPNVAGFAAQQNGSVVVMSWEIAPGKDIDGYDIRRSDLDNLVGWDDAEIVTRVTRGTQLTTAAVPPGAHRLMIKAFDGPGNESLAPAVADIVVTNPNDVVLDATQTARWPGTLTGFRKHFVSGSLVPESRLPANLHTNAQLFEQFVPFPVAMSTYETRELDLGFDAASVRVFGSLAARRCGENGLADPRLELDYRAAAGVFDGYEPWTIGVIDLRYAKARVTIDHATGTAYLQGMRLFFDVPERVEQAKNVGVPIGGLAIVFAERFHTVPTIQVQAKPAAGALRIANYDNEDVTGFEVRIFDPAGTETGGTLQFWRATGG